MRKAFVFLIDIGFYGFGYRNGVLGFSGFNGNVDSVHAVVFKVAFTFNESIVDISDIAQGYLSAARTDFDGNFKIILPEKTAANNFKLEFTSIGYENKIINVDAKSKILNIELKMETLLMGEVAIVKKMNVFRRVGYFFKRLF